MSTIDVSFINIYVGNQTPGEGLNEAFRGHPSFVGINEGRNVIPILARQHDDYELFKGKDARDPRSVMDSILMVEGDLVSLGQGAFAANKAAAPFKIAPERWIVYSMNKIGSHKYCVAVGHNHAAVQGRDKNIKRVQESFEFMKSYALFRRMTLTMGFRNIFMGDLNWSTNGEQVRWSPVSTFGRMKMNYINTGMGYIAWDYSMQMTDHSFMPKSKTGSNHDGIRVSLRSKRRNNG